MMKFPHFQRDDKGFSACPRPCSSPEAPCCSLSAARMNLGLRTQDAIRSNKRTAEAGIICDLFLRCAWENALLVLSTTRFSAQNAFYYSVGESNDFRLESLFRGGD